MTSENPFKPPQFKSVEEQDAYILASLSEGTCPCCHTKLNRERTCGMGYTWDIKRGVITSGPEPKIERPSGSYGLMQVMSTETNYDYKRYADRDWRNSNWYGKIEIDYYSNEANLTGDKFAQFAKLYGGIID